jgi:hypothetical protein
MILRPRCTTSCLRSASFALHVSATSDWWNPSPNLLLGVLVELADLLLRAAESTFHRGVDLRLSVAVGEHYTSQEVDDAHFHSRLGVDYGVKCFAPTQTVNC